ncbi:MAG: hypothetical protein RL685_424 [Pseudomonadota bacterium]|jgi:uncharacterized iron-regulated membrane protein
METTFRKSMTWLHTWSGVTMCTLLFAIFWMGTLSVFDREIDRWMLPHTRLPAPSASAPSLDAAAVPLLQEQAPRSSQWSISLPTERAPMLRLSWRDAEDQSVNRYFDPATGGALPEAGSFAGTSFIYPFHYRLHLRFMDLGEWLVGLLTMGMLVAIVTGVVIHKKIFREFFTFRPRSKSTMRAALDLHNLTGVVALPFHVIISLSGLFIFFATYFPAGWQAAYDGDRQPFNREANQSFQRAKAGAPGTLASLDAMTAEARRLWGSGEPAQVRVNHPGDANGYVEIRRAHDDRITRNSRIVYFDAASGAVLARAGDHRPVKGTLEFLQGLHRIQFQHWALRWLYFACGLAGCVMIATGFVVWLQVRRVQHEKQGLSGVWFVEWLAVGSVTGMIAATFAFFVANRLLAPGARFAGLGRAELEMAIFYLVWLSSFAHGAWRARAAWAEQCLLIAVLAVAAVLLNWLTTGHHLAFTLSRGSSAVAGMDLLLLLAAAGAGFAVRRLRLRSVGAARALGAGLTARAGHA